MLNKSIAIFLFMSLCILVSCENPVEESNSDTEKQLEQIKKMNLDWPNLKKYSRSNRDIKNDSDIPSEVVLMGNSITEAWPDFSPEFFDEHPFVCRGISGQTTPQMLIRFKPDVVNLKPKIVVILAGTNDLAENTGPASNEMIQDNISSMAEIAKANGIHVILSSIIPVFDYPWKPGMEPADRIIAINQWMKEYASKNEMIYLDYHSAMVDERKGLKKELSPDEVHPNKKGYQIMEGLLLEAIAKIP